MVILLPELAEDDLTGAHERVSKYITDATGTVKEILAESPWGRRRLAYTIRFNGQDYRDGNYAIWHFDLEPSRMSEIERELKLDTRVMRYLVVHDDPKWGSPNGGNQPPPGEEDDRGPRRPESERRRPDGPRRPEGERRPAPVAQDASAATAPPSSGSAEAGSAGDAGAPIADTVASSNDAVVTTDQSVITTDEAVTTPETTVGTTGEALDPAPEATGAAAPEPGASGEETTAVVADTTGAAVEAPVDEPAGDATNSQPDDEQ